MSQLTKFDEMLALIQAGKHPKVNADIKAYTQENITHYYNSSEKLALSLGYVEYSDVRAYHGRYFIKDNKKWIHNIEALRRKLNREHGHYVTDEELLYSFGYDVEAYYCYNMTDNSLVRHNQFNQMMHKVHLN